MTTLRPTEPDLRAKVLNRGTLSGPLLEDTQRRVATVLTVLNAVLPTRSAGGRT